MLKVRALQLTAITGSTRYRTLLKFESGLNVICAENTSGKSTALQAIVYALGLEKMWGPRVGVPLAHAMQQRIQPHRDGPFEAVVQSFVELEIENHAGHRLTVRRDVVGGAERRLIHTWPTNRLTGGESGSERDFFVQLPGAALREDGFHTYLAQFIGLDLPTVTRFNGSEGPLYLETVFPLLFVEQKRGWSAIQGPFPTQYQIQDVARRAMEFILDLDIGRARRELADIGHKIKALRDSWSTHVTATRSMLPPSCRLDMPAQPTAEFAHDGHISAEAMEAGVWAPLDEVLTVIRRRHATISKEPIITTTDAAAGNETELAQAQSELEAQTVTTNDIRHNLRGKTEEQAILQSRINDLTTDLRRHQDAKQLKQLGSTLSKIIEDGHCPTCHQSMAAELLPTTPTAVMAIDENEVFLKSQIRLYGASLAGLERSIVSAKSTLAAFDERCSTLRSRIRTLRQALTRPGQTPSQARIAEIVELDRRVNELGNTQQRIDEIVDQLRSIAKEFAALKAREKELSDELLSATDREKIRKLTSILRERLKEFGFASFAIEEVSLAEDNFRPVMDQKDGDDIVQREIGINISASDGARLKWAYYLALLELTASHSTNHPGLVIFDEPGQQQMKELDLGTFVGRAAAATRDNQQIIIATSQSKQFVTDALAAGGRANVLTFRGFVLRPDE